MGRTHKKLQSHRFKKGNIPHNKGLKLDESYSPAHTDVAISRSVRLPKHMFDLVTKNVTHNRESSLLAGPNSARLLRPKSPVRSETQYCADTEQFLQ